MAQATVAHITTRVAFTPLSAALLNRRAGPLPLAQPIGTGWMPVIYHAERKVDWLQFERFPRKVNATGAEALAHATRVIWYRGRRAADKRRRLDAITHPRYAFLQAAE